MRILQQVMGAAIVAAIIGFPPKAVDEPRVPPARPAGQPVTFREQVLDTDVPAPPHPPLQLPPHVRKPPPKECTAIEMAPNGNRRVRTPADEDLPDWVPICGRLTVIESSDMAENLGLVPPGTSKANPGRIISVAELLEKEAAARPPPTAAPYIMGETFVDAR